jgi:serine/threonine protein kinase
VQLRSKRALLQQYHRVYHKPSDYKFLRRLSRGAFGTVYLAKYLHKDSKPLAIKVIEKRVIRDGEFESQIMRERSVMTVINGTSALFVQLRTAFQTRDRLFMAMDFVQGGDCCSYLLSKGKLPEHTAKFIVGEVARALNVLHSLGFMHRDIKPDNILFTIEGHIKLADFGMAAPLGSLHAKSAQGLDDSTNVTGDQGFHWQLQSIYSANGGDGPFSPVSMTGGMLSPDSSGSGMSLALRGNNANDDGFRNSLVGNVSYAAPEAVIGSYYNQSVDWWALGVLFFHLIAGKTPFEAPTSDEIMDNILNSRLNWSFVPNSISKECMYVTNPTV